MGFLGGALDNPLDNAENLRLGLIPGSGDSPGGECGNVHQYFYLEDPMDCGARQARVHRGAKSQTRLK